MSHHFQKTKRKTYDLIAKFVAQSMPNGAKDLTFRAILRTYGMSRRLVDEMLLDLQEAGRIEFDEDTKAWKLPTVEDATGEGDKNEQ